MYWSEFGNVFPIILLAILVIPIFLAIVLLPSIIIDINLLKKYELTKKECIWVCLANIIGFLASLPFKSCFVISFYIVSFLIKIFCFRKRENYVIKLWHIALLNLLPTVCIGLIWFFFNK